MQQVEQRSEPRLPVSFRGSLTLGGTTTPCVVQNLCSRGFLIKYSEELPLGPVGQLLRLECELYPAQVVECTVQVRHVNRDWLGARVIEIGDAARFICQRFLAEQQAARPNGVAPA